MSDQRSLLKGLLKEELDKVTGVRMQAQQAAEKPRKPSKNAVQRANGKKYMPRELRNKSGIADVDGLRALRDKGLFTLLYGPPGSGKTALVEAAFPSDLYTVTGDENTNTDDFMGQWAPTGDPSKWVWVDGPAVLAAKNGGVLFIDDITLIDPRVLAVIYPAMDGRGGLIVKNHIVDGKPEIVTIAPGFYVIGAHNPGVHGAVLSDALSSRFTAQILVETDMVLAGTLGTPERMLRVVRMLRAERDNKDSGLWVPQLREMLGFRDLTHVYGEEVAASNLIGLAPEGPDRDILAEKVQIVFGKNVTRFELGGQL